MLKTVVGHTRPAGGFERQGGFGGLVNLAAVKVTGGCAIGVDPLPVHGACAIGVDVFQADPHAAAVVQPRQAGDEGQLVGRGGLGQVAGVAGYGGVGRGLLLGGKVAAAVGQLVVVAGGGTVGRGAVHKHQRIARVYQAAQGGVELGRCPQWAFAKFDQGARVGVVEGQVVETASSAQGAVVFQAACVVGLADVPAAKKRSVALRAIGPHPAPGRLSAVAQLANGCPDVIAAGIAGRQVVGLLGQCHADAHGCFGAGCGQVASLAGHALACSQGAGIVKVGGCCAADAVVMTVLKAVEAVIGRCTGLHGQQVHVDGGLHFVRVHSAGVTLVDGKHQTLAHAQYHLLHGRARAGRVGQGVFTGLYWAGRDFNRAGAGRVDFEHLIRRGAGCRCGVRIPEACIDCVHTRHLSGELDGRWVHLAGQHAHGARAEGERGAVLKPVGEEKAWPAGGGIAHPGILVLELDEVTARAPRVSLHGPGRVGLGEGLKGPPVEVAGVAGVACDDADRPGAVGAVAIERVEVAANAPAEVGGFVVEIVGQRVPGHQVGLVAFEAGVAVERGGNFTRADDAVVDAHVADAAFPEVPAELFDVGFAVHIANAQSGASQRRLHAGGGAAHLDAIDVDRARSAAAGDGVLVPLAVGWEGVVDGPAVAQAQVPAAPRLVQDDEEVICTIALRQDGVLPISHIAVNLCPGRHREVATHGQARLHGVDVVVYAVKRGVAHGPHIGRLQLHGYFAQVVVGPVAGAEREGAQHFLVLGCAGVATECEHAGGRVVAFGDAVCQRHIQRVTADEVAAHLFGDADRDFADGVVAGVAGVGRVGIAQSQTRVDAHCGAQGVTRVGSNAQAATV